MKLRWLGVTGTVLLLVGLVLMVAGPRLWPVAFFGARAGAMRHPGRVHFAGHIADPASALSGADIFFYPLQADHYGTAENALVEAMSLGVVPVEPDEPLPVEPPPVEPPPDEPVTAATSAPA